MGNFPLSGRRVVKPGVPSIAGILVADSYSPPSFTDWQTIQTTSDNEGDPRTTSSSHTATRSPSDEKGQSCVKLANPPTQTSNEKKNKKT